ncbi:Transposase [Sphingomonas sp. OK281]|nr:Transposase [Sphingomonas sp. OK281]
MLSSDACDELLQLRTELAVARDLAEKAQANALNAEAARVRAINSDLLARNAHFEWMNEKMRRDKYGASSERSRRLIDQLELTFEELEADAAEAERLGAIASAKATMVTAFTCVRSTRRDFDPGLPREQVVIPAPDLCPCCGSADLSHLPADITETLEKVPARHKVIQTVREKVSCRRCEKTSQPPAPFHVTPRGMFGPHFLASLIFQKYGLDQPLNSQCDGLESVGISLSNCVQALRYSVLFLTMALSVMRSFRMVATIASLKGLPASRSRLVVAARRPLPQRAMVSAAR